MPAIKNLGQLTTNPPSARHGLAQRILVLVYFLKRARSCLSLTSNAGKTSSDSAAANALAVESKERKRVPPASLTEAMIAVSKVPTGTLHAYLEKSSLHSRRSRSQFIGST